MMLQIIKAVRVLEIFCVLFLSTISTLGSQDGLREEEHRDSLNIHSVALRQYTAPSWKDPFINLPDTWAKWYAAEFRSENILYYTGIAAMTAGLIVTDRETYDPVRKWYVEDKTFRVFCDYSEYMGQGWFQFGLAGAFAIHGYLDDNNRSLNTATQTVEVILSCGAVIQLLKHVTGRETPILSSTPTGIWRFFPNQIAYHKEVPKYDAFPTGHLATATATLTVIMDNYPEAEWIPYVGYPAIAFIGIGMVGQGIHWWSDYPLGIAIGYSFAKVVTGRSLSALPSPDTSSLVPSISIGMHQGGSPSLNFGWRL